MTKNIYQKLKSASEEARMVKKTEKKGGMNFNPLEHDAVQGVAMAALIKNGFFKKKEFIYLRAWVKDCENIKLI